MKDPRPTATIRLHGTFDLPAARLLQSSLKRIAPGERVLVDFGGVRELHDFAIAVLASALERSRTSSVRLVGLRFHHVRLLRYFGIAPELFRPEGRERDRDAE